MIKENTMQIIAWTVGWSEILIIVLIVLILFGAKKIPELMRGLGSGIKEFKKASSIEDDNNTTNKQIDNNNPNNTNNK
jgi:sec-independent protein translocase protein TatA